MTGVFQAQSMLHVCNQQQMASTTRQKMLQLDNALVNENIYCLCVSLWLWPEAQYLCPQSLFVIYSRIPRYLHHMK